MAETDDEVMVEEEEEDDDEPDIDEIESGEESLSATIQKEDAAFIEETWGEMPEGEEEGEEEEEGKKVEKVEQEEEEEVMEEEPPDPTAPYDLSDEKEAKKAPFELNAEQIQEVQDIWDGYQNYTPAYTDLQGYVTEKELVYMLKCLNLQTFTPEQLQELIIFCVRPPNSNGYVYLDNFLHMVTIRTRDMPLEEQIRLGLEVFDPENTGNLDREDFRLKLKEHGRPLTNKQTDELIKEVDMTNDGVLAREDVVGTICIDLARDEIEALIQKVFPKEETDDTKINQLTATEVPATIPGARET